MTIYFKFNRRWPFLVIVFQFTHKKMINNEFQYHITKREAEKFAIAIGELEANSPLSEWDEIHVRAMRGQLETLQEEIAEWERDHGKRP